LIKFLLDMILWYLEASHMHLSASLYGSLLHRAPITYENARSQNLYAFGRYKEMPSSVERKLVLEIAYENVYSALR
jgi:hypothetical protein